MKPGVRADPRDGLIASQKTELARLQQENKRLRQPRAKVPTRRSVALAALTKAMQGSDKPGERVLQPLTPPLLLGRKMGAAVVAMLKEMTLETRRLVRSLAKGPAEQLPQAMDAPRDLERWPRGGSVPSDAQRRLEALQDRYRVKFAALAEDWSRRMIAGVEAQSTAQLSIGLKDMAERMEIRATMAEPRMRAIVEASTQSCTQLIKRIPQEYLSEVQVAVMSAITTGSGLEQLVPYLTKRYEGDARHARFVALDQVRKASANVNAARLQAVGVQNYIWVHVSGERYPRELHMQMSGKEYRYDDPPVIQKAKGNQPEVKGKPGDLPFCRCVARPVLRFQRD